MYGRYSRDLQPLRTTCDRCRDQKVRCDKAASSIRGDRNSSRNDRGGSACMRCAKAGTACIYSPQRRNGRPPAPKDLDVFTQLVGVTNSPSSPTSSPTSASSSLQHTVQPVPSNDPSAEWSNQELDSSAWPGVDSSGQSNGTGILGVDMDVGIALDSGDNDGDGAGGGSDNDNDSNIGDGLDLLPPNFWSHFHDMDIEKMLSNDGFSANHTPITNFTMPSLGHDIDPFGVNDSRTSSITAMSNFGLQIQRAMTVAQSVPTAGYASPCDHLAIIATALLNTSDIFVQSCTRNKNGIADDGDVEHQPHLPTMMMIVSAYHQLISLFKDLCGEIHIQVARRFALPANSSNPRAPEQHQWKSVRPIEPQISEVLPALAQTSMATGVIGNLCNRLNKGQQRLASVLPIDVSRSRKPSLQLQPAANTPRSDTRDNDVTESTATTSELSPSQLGLKLLIDSLTHELDSLGRLITNIRLSLDNMEDTPNPAG